MRQHRQAAAHENVSGGKSLHQRECQCGWKSDWKSHKNLAAFLVEEHIREQYGNLCQQYKDNQCGMPVVITDGGRAASGRKGQAGDCVTRAIAIATGRPYDEVYDDLHDRKREFGTGRSRAAKHAAKNPSPRNGVPKEVIKQYMTDLGWTWTPTMQIGKGTTVHLRPGELPAGRLVVHVSKHVVAVIDGAVHDAGDPCRDGTRAVYGYWTKGN